MAKRSPRTKQPEPPVVTSGDRVQSLVRLFNAIAKDHAASGGSSAEWDAAWKQFSDRGPDEDTERTDHFETLGTFGRLLEHWYSEADWLENGQPRPLKPNSRGGFPALCRALGLAEKPAGLASLGLATGVLTLTPDGSLLPTDRTAIVTRPSPMILDMFSVGLTAWLSTARHNTQPSTNDDNRRVDRGIFDNLIPAKLEGAYHRMVREAGKRCLDTVDDWLAAHRAAPTDADIRRVTFHLFSASDDAKPAKKPKNKGRRRASR